jgi:hypothetical protein
MKKYLAIFFSLALAAFGQQQLNSVKVQQLFNYAGPYTPQYMDRFVNPTAPGIFGFGADKAPIFWTLGTNLSVSGGALNATTGGASGPAGGVLSGTYPNPGFANIAAYSILSNNTGSAAPPVAAQSLILGTPSIADTGIASQFTGSVAGYYQHIIQNTSAAANASTDLVLNNNLGTASTYYANLGINSSAFTGAGSLNLPNASYLTATTGELVLGTTTANGVHVTLNNGATDALAFTSGGALSLPGLTSNGPLITSGGTGAVSVGGTTGSGNYVLANSPALTTPNIGAATGTSLSVSGQLTSTVATGTPPFVVSSTTQVANLNAATAGSAPPSGAAGGFLAGTYPNPTVSTTASFPGYFTIPKTTSNTVGVIQQNAAIVFHSYQAGVQTQSSLFFGLDTGNFSATATAYNNYGFGGRGENGERGPFHNLTTGDENAAFGGGALGQLTSGARNNAFGSVTLSLIQDGQDNVAMGTNTLSGVVHGSQNTGVGNNTLTGSGEVNQTTAIGQQALANFIGTGTVGIGYQAGSSSLSGNLSTWIGTSSGSSAGNVSGIVALGAFSDTYGTANNELHINNQDRGSRASELTGDLIYGVFNATPASQTLKFNAVVSAYTTTLTDTTGKILSAALNTVQPAQGGTGITSLGTNVATWLGTPSVTNLNAALTGGPVITNTGGTVTSNAIVLGNGTTDTKVATGLTTDGVSELNLGVAGASVGEVNFFNATSGSIALEPPTGALGTVTVTLPSTTGTLLTGNQTITLSGDVTGSGTTAITTALGNIPTATPAAGSILNTNIAAPGTPAAGKTSTYVDSTDKRFHDKNDAGTIGTTVVSNTGSANNFVTGISTAGVVSTAQPAFSNLSGSATAAQMPAFTGDVTTSAGSTVTALGNIPSGTTAAGSVLATNIAAPSTPASGKSSIYVDSTSKNLAVKNDAGTVNHGVQTKAVVGGQFVTGIADDGTVSTGAAGGGAALSAITAATASNTIASGNNTGQVWNWANTTDSTVAYTLGETSAATGGTSTGGVPNQVLHKITTLAASTQSPLSVYEQGNHVFSVSPSAQQILATNGAAANPIYGFAAEIGTGMWRSTGSLNFARLGTSYLAMGANVVYVAQGASSTAPGLTDIINSNTGYYWPAANVISLVNATDGEWTRWGSFFQQNNQAGANTTAYATNYRKARGTVSSPTVITTGDDLMQTSGYGYVGATNTYLEAARIKFQSTGTIADSTSGIGSKILFYTTKAGTDTSPQLALTMQGGSVPQLLAPNGTSTNPAYSFSSTPASGMFYSGKLWIEDAAQISFGIGGSQLATLTANSFYVPNSTGGNVQSLTDVTSSNSGLFIASGLTGISVSNIENSRFVAGAWQPAKSTADAVSYAVNFRKSRGTVLAPTVITTGDDLASITGNGYVGATNTYLQASQIKFTSTGTIADSTSGIGGQIKFYTTLAGTDTSPQLGATISGGSSPVTTFAGTVNHAGLAFVTSQYDATTNTTLTNVPGLSVTVVAGKTYKFRVTLHLTPDTVGGQKIRMAGTATATNIIYEVLSVNNTSNANIISSRITDLGTTSVGVAGGTSDFTTLEGYIVVNAGGTLTCQFAQTASNGTSSVLVGSLMEVFGG